MEDSILKNGLQSKKKTWLKWTKKKKSQTGK